MAIKRYILILFLLFCTNAYSQLLPSIEFVKKVKCNEYISAITTNESFTQWYLASRYELMIVNKNLVKVIDKSYTVDNPSISLVGNKVYVGHKIYNTKEKEFESEGDFWGTLESFFDYDNVSLNSICKPTSLDYMVVSVSYGGPDRRIGAKAHYFGPKYKVLLIPKGTDSKELFHTSINPLVITANKRFIVASLEGYDKTNSETIVWNKKGEEIGKIPEGFSKIELHKRLNYAVATNVRNKLYVFNTTSWEKLEVKGTEKAQDFIMHPEKPIVFALKSDSLNVFELSDNSLNKIIAMEAKEEFNAMDIVSNKLILFNSNSGNIYTLDISGL